METFEERNRRFIANMGADERLREATRRWFETAARHEYSYHFSWLGVPVIQFPQDLVAMQEIIWAVKPELIIETGIARGGSLVFYASMLQLVGEGTVLGIDVDIRPHTVGAVEGHPLRRRMRTIEGSSTDPAVVAQVREAAAGRRPVLVALDSNHTHDHVLRELELYAPLVTRGSYLVVFDTIIDFMPEAFSTGRPWGPGCSPSSALLEFLRTTDRFEVDAAIHDKLQITAAPGGYLKCVGDP